MPSNPGVDKRPQRFFPHATLSKSRLMGATTHCMAQFQKQPLICLGSWGSNDIRRECTILNTKDSSGHDEL
eukprot:2551004-Amphidinium_carterae.1